MILRNLLIKHEGVRLHPYRCTSGKLTIGIGRNLEDKGISYQEAVAMLDNDIIYFESKLSVYDWYEPLNSVRKFVVIDMTFNLGLKGFLKFSKMLGALKSQDYFRASREMLDSTWAKQVKGRAIELSEMMRTGQYNDSDNK